MVFSACSSRVFGSELGFGLGLAEQPQARPGLCPSLSGLICKMLTILLYFVGVLWNWSRGLLGEFTVRSHQFSFKYFLLKEDFPDESSLRDPH